MLEPHIRVQLSPIVPGEIARFSKYFQEDWLFHATLRNSMRAYVAARRARWLHVPRVLSADLRALKIDYELLVGWTPLRAILRDRTFRGLAPAELERTFWIIGAGLGEFHRYTRRIHGDFDFDNILVKRGLEKVALVDFTPPEYAHFRCYNQADPYRDLATFIIFVRGKYPPHRLHLAFRPELNTAARAFIAGYCSVSNSRFDQQRLERHLIDLLETTYLGDTFTARYLRHTRLFRTDDLAPES